MFLFNNKDENDWLRRENDRSMREAIARIEAERKKREENRSKSMGLKKKKGRQ